MYRGGVGGGGGRAQCTVHVQNFTAHVYVAHVCKKKTFQRFCLLNSQDHACGKKKTSVNSGTGKFYVQL